ncbi:MAG TPA: tail fiber domain-containing protein [Longimicrobium sp.]|jgi:hypothetical protein|uniref:tail fiber domain-containing protein n=1 Tax=Longimicrobium sp. TaxID=2029185 RepID=UPI002ED97670
MKSLNLALLAAALAAVPSVAAAQSADSVFAVSKSGSSLLRVNTNGNVGVGTSTPDRRLTVNGSVGADSVAVSSAVVFPDGTVQTTAAVAASGTSSNTPNSLVKRDSIGGFAAGRATLDSLAVSGRSALGTASVTKLTVADSLTASAGVRFADGTVQTTAATTATGTSTNTANALVKRDGNGDFSAGTSTLRALTISDNEANAGASVRLQIRSGSNLGTRFVVDSAGGLLAGGSLGIGIILAEGEGYRMLWHPYRASFRAGGVSGDQWNDANMGFFSAAFGQNVQAEGNWSFASGHSTFTDQPYSVAMGFASHANGTAAIAMGYRATADASYALALGRAVSARGNEGAIVIGDGSTSDSLQATAANQFSLRAAGGIRMFTNSAKTAGVLMQAYPGSASTPWTGCGNVQWVISASNCAYLSNAGAWTNVSDVNRKHGFAAVAGEDVLTRLRGMPISTWTYNTESSDVRHMGPTAQDFHAAFGLNGADNTHIATIDGDGVALAAAKALEARTASQAETIAAQQRTIDAQGREIADLRARLERIEAALAAQATAQKP